MFDDDVELDGQDCGPIVPGPCVGRCPKPTEIDCIQVNKVYDFCFEADTNNNVCSRIPSDCRDRIQPGATATATVSGATCSVIGSTPILDAAGNPTGFADVTLLVTVTIQYTITSATGTIICVFNGQFSFIKTIVLCAPDGTTVDCTVPQSVVSPVAILGREVCGTVTVCLLISSVALVNLLVPSYGFCTPAPCMVSPSPPFSCPPSPLYPVQCTPLPTD